MKNLYKPLFASTLILSSLGTITSASAAHSYSSFNFRSSNIITGNSYNSPRYMGHSRRARTRTTFRKRRSFRQKGTLRSYRAERRAAFRAAFTDE